MALNILSTGVMVRLGKVHGNRMVDVAVTNSKLEDRALRILRDLAGVDRVCGAELLAEAQGSVKLALLMALTGVNGDRGRQLLTEQGPSLRQALAAQASRDA
jgi:N-acetylmuramic acid 6-phosphate etherase